MYADQTEDLREARAKNAKGQAEMLKNYQRVFSSDVGKAVMKDMIRRFYMGNTAVAGDPYTTYFLEGQRAVVRDILDKLKINVDELFDRLLSQD